MNKSCSYCSKEFKTYPCRIRINQGKFCSVKCADKSKIGKAGFWQDKKRPDLVNTKAVHTMFKKNQKPWNDGIEWDRMKGENNPRYKNGTYINSEGYVVKRFNRKKTIFYHRYLIEQQLERKLRQDEHVHHINFDRQDNRLENLILLSVSEHMKYHASIKERQRGKFI